VAKQLSGVDATSAAVVAGLGLGLPLLAAWKAAYGGFAGVLQPEEAMEILQVCCAVLCCTSWGVCIGCRSCAMHLVCGA